MRANIWIFVTSRVLTEVNHLLLMCTRERSINTKKKPASQPSGRPARGFVPNPNALHQEQSGSYTIKQPKVCLKIRRGEGRTKNNPKTIVWGQTLDEQRSKRLSESVYSTSIYFFLDDTVGHIKQHKLY